MIIRFLNGGHQTRNIVRHGAVPGGEALMRKVMILGTGKVGSLIGTLLVQTGDYVVRMADSRPGEADRLVRELPHPGFSGICVDATDRDALQKEIVAFGPNAVVSALPYYCNTVLAQVAADHGIDYFDLTEDVEVTRSIKKISAGANAAFVPQCGLAPGFISIVANHHMRHFEELDTVKLRVGALPVNPSNVLKYSLTWSTDGLINEYGNTCYGVEGGKEVALMPLEGHETIEVDGLLYEAFNTSGGIGTLADTYDGKVRTMNYRTMRYPGHCEKIHFLMNDLKLNGDRDTLKRILENAVPKTLQDVVLIYVAVSGKQRGELFEENYVKKVYPQKISGRTWSAIQVTTATGLCAVLDMVESTPGRYKGFVTQETFSLDDFLANRFGVHYR
jgi:saccharopine dehydrogenase-like NADP-dependent oxidoreductase